MLRSLYVIVSASVVCASFAGAQARKGKTAPPVAGAFIVRLGNDTVAVEQFVKSANKLEGDVVLRSPSTRVIHYVADLGPDGNVTRLESALRPGNAWPNSPAAQTSTLVWSGDTAVVSMTRGDSTNTIRVAAVPGTIPYTAGSYALYELALRKAIDATDSVQLTMLPVGARRTSALTARRVGRDTIYFMTLNGPMQARIDRRTGEILSSRIVGGTQQFTAERVKLNDFPAIVARFVARDVAGARMGQLSPPDSVVTKIGTANVTVKYSRPSRRGRTVFGGTLVPWNAVWRTGANAATSFTTDADLVIGGTSVPAGSYTLFTVPTPDGWTLIINKQTGQWGTVYDEKQDLARIPMQLTRLSSPVEQFTIAIDPGPQGSVLRMAWDDRQGSIPITVR